jgi:hypothetical protein
MLLPPSQQDFTSGVDLFKDVYDQTQKQGLSGTERWNPERQRVYRIRVEVILDMLRRIMLRLGAGQAPLEAATPSAAAPGSSLSPGNARGWCSLTPAHESGQGLMIWLVMISYFHLITDCRVQWWAENKASTASSLLEGSTTTSSSKKLHWEKATVLLFQQVMIEF